MDKKEQTIVVIGLLQPCFRQDLLQMSTVPDSTTLVAATAAVFPEAVNATLADKQSGTQSLPANECHSNCKTPHVLMGNQDV